MPQVDSQLGILIESVARRVAVMAWQVGLKRNVAFIVSVAKNEGIKVGLEKELGISLICHRSLRSRDHLELHLLDSVKLSSRSLASFLLKQSVYVWSCFARRHMMSIIKIFK